MVVDHICVNFGATLFHELFKELHRRGVEQNVFYPRSRLHLEADGNSPYAVDSPLILGASTKISFRKKQRLMRQHYDPLFHRNNPDLIHAHTLFSDGSLANHCHEHFGTPFVVSIRSSDLDIFLKYKPWLYPEAVKTLKNASCLVFISPALRIKFRKKFGDRYENKSLVLPNGIHQSYFQEELAARKEAHAPPELLYVGSFLRRKNVPSLIRMVKETGAGLSLVGLGGGHEKKVLRMIRNSLNIKYLGRINDTSRLMEIYRQRDIFVMTSRRETFGIVYIEAMSQGLPLIYSTGTGIDGLFPDGAVGFGVRPGSVTEMKAAVKRILDDYQRISGNCISEAGQFNWEAIADSYLGLYKSITG